MAEFNNCMSIGFDWHNARKETRCINGVDTVCIVSTTLFEISFMSGYNGGAVRDAFATLKDTDYGKSLKDECRDFLFETAAVNFKRSFQGFTLH